jgi:hypothetical protein
MITPKQAENLSKAGEAYFKDLGWSKEDINFGMIHLTLTLTILSQVKGIIPLDSEKFPEVLRALANMLDLNNKIVKENINKLDGK